MRLERVRFRGVPGVEHDLDLRFASGLNVVLGSNGSGKSTLMALVRDSLWKPDPKGCRGEADLEWRPDAGGAPLDHALRPHGRRLSFPGALPPMAQCYAVHIRDLLPDLSGADLAAALRVEIAGGLDLDALRAEPPVLDGRRREARELAVASAELQRVETEQRSVAAEEARLTELLDARDGAASAVRDLPALEARRAWFAAARLAESLRRRVAEFGPVTERLVGDELEQLAQLRRRLDEAQQEMQVGARTVERAAQRIREAGIGEVPPSAAALAELRSLADGIGEHAAELAGLQRALLEHRARARAVQEAVGDPPQSWRTDRAALRRLTRLVQRAEQAARDTAAIDARLQRCRMRRPCATSGALREGHRLLTDWLAADAGLWTPRWAWQSAVALGLVGVGLAFACGGWWSALGGLGVGLLVAPFVQRPLRLARRSELQAAFLELGLAAPERWAARAVRARLRGVNDAWARRRIAERERDFAQGLLAARRTAHKVEARGRDLAQQAAEQLGLELDAAAPLTSLVHFDRLATLHDHTTEVRGLELRIARLDERVREALQRVNRLLTDAGRPEVETPAAARASAASFEADARALAQALEQRAQGRETVALHRQRIDEIEALRVALFTGVGLADRDDAGLAALLVRRREHLHLLQELRRVEDAIERDAAVVGDRPSLLALSADEIDRAIDGAKAMRPRLAALSEEIGGIRARVSAAAEGHALAAALERTAVADEAAGACRDEARRLAARAFWLEWVEAEQDEAQRPAVLRRAAEWFLEFTRKQWSLEFDATAGSFAARDNATGRVRPLEHLSDGTRMQLLMAARLAFVESQEDGERLPLMFDEALGTADPLRFEAVFGVLLQVVERGRQVFYCTADPSDVAVIEDLCGRTGVPAPRIVDLDQARDAAGAPRRTLALAPPPRRTVPAPLPGQSADEYGAELRVAAPRPFMTAAELDLFFVLTDRLDLLYRLRQAGFQRVGHWQAVAGKGAGARHLEDSDERALVDARCRLAEAFFARWAIGRGRPLHMRDLDRAQLCTDAFRDRLERSLEKHGNRAERLIEDLDAKVIRGFRKTAELKAFCHQEGFLDQTRSVLDPAELRWQLGQVLDTDRRVGLVDEARIEELVRRLCPALAP